MKLWVVLVAVTLLAGCGAHPSPPEPTPTPGPSPLRIWGVLGALEEAAANATARLRRVPLLQKLRSLVTELGSQASGLSAGLRAEAAEAWERAAEYGGEARAALELGWGEVKNRGATYGRKLRKRLHRDGEELKKRWEAYGHALGERAAALRRSWGDPWGPQDVED